MAQGRHSIQVLNSEEAKQGRLARKAQWIVWVEFGDGFVELDADSKSHAVGIASAWLETMTGAMSASVRSVKADGKTLCKMVLSQEPKDDWF